MCQWAKNLQHSHTPILQIIFARQGAPEGRKEEGGSARTDRHERSPERGRRRKENENEARKRKIAGSEGQDFRHMTYLCIVNIMRIQRKCPAGAGT